MIGAAIERTWQGSRGSELDGQAALEWRKRYDDIAAMRSSTRLYRGQLAAEWTLPAPRGRRGFPPDSIRTEWVLGHVALGTPVQKAVDGLTARTKGHYAVVRAEADWARQLGPGRMTIYLSGQWATKNLATDEKHSISGDSRVRALSGGRSLGDDGWFFRGEYAHPPVRPGGALGQIYPSVFFEVGGVTYNKRPWDATGVGGRVVSGAGIALRWVVCDHFLVQMHQGWMPSDSQGVASPGDPGHLSIRLTYSF